MSIRFFIPALVVISLLYSCTSSSPGDVKEEVVSGPGSGLLTLFNSGKKQSLSPEDYMNWVQDKDNGLVAESEIGHYRYSAFFKPLDYVVLKDWREDKIDATLFKEKTEAYNGLQYYTFILERNDEASQELLRYDLNDNQDYFSRVEYYSFQVQQDFRLVEGKDTLFCRMAHFERSYGLQSKIKILVAFDRKPGQQNKKESYASDKLLLFYDRVFGAGIVKLRIDQKTLQNIPDLKLG